MNIKMSILYPRKTRNIKKVSWLIFDKSTFELVPFFINHKTIVEFKNVI